MDREFSFTPEEVDVIVEALQIQRERWQDARIKKITGDPSVSDIRLEEIEEGTPTRGPPPPVRAPLVALDAVMGWRVTGPLLIALLGAIGCRGVDNDSIRDAQIELRDMCAVARHGRDDARVLLTGIAAAGVSDVLLEDATDVLNALEYFVAQCRAYPVAWFLRQDIPD